MHYRLLETHVDALRDLCARGVLVVTPNGAVYPDGRTVEDVHAHLAHDVVLARYARHASARNRRR